MSKTAKVEEKAMKKSNKEIEDFSSLSIRNIGLIFQTFWEGYSSSTPKKIKLLDAFSLSCFIITGIQILYCIIVGSFPMNSFLSGVFASLGALIITGSS